MVVSRDRGYRVLRVTDNGETQRLRGKIAEDQFKNLKTLLDNSDFRTLSGTQGGLIRGGAESFAAEVSRADSSQRLKWLNPDGESPFPDAIAKIVSWLQAFKAKDGEPFAYAEFPDVCPSEGFRLLQPSVASVER